MWRFIMPRCRHCLLAAMLLWPVAACPQETRVADDGQWPMASRDPAGTRFSGLTEITPENVANLQVAWTFSTGLTRGHEAAPLVVNNMMYVVTPYPNYVYAIDLK